MHKKIKDLIKRLNDRMFLCYESYFIWKYLFLSHNLEIGEDLAKSNVNKLNKYKDFFIQTENAHLIFFIIRIAKFFDNPKNNNKPLSIIKVKNCAQGNRKELNGEAFIKQNPNRPFIKELGENYKGIQEDKIKEIDDLVSKNEEIISIFKNLRDKRAAHEDISKIEIKIPSFEKTEGLLKDISEMINTLSYGLEHSTTMYSHIEPTIKKNIENLLKNI